MGRPIGAQALDSLPLESTGSAIPPLATMMVKKIAWCCAAFAAAAAAAAALLQQPLTLRLLLLQLRWLLLRMLSPLLLLR